MNRYAEDDLLPLSGLQHLLFCERQAALIHVERLWEDNRYTLEGTHLHRRVDEMGPRRERRDDLLISRGLPLRSFRLGLSGRADVVEFHGVRGDTSTEDGGADRPPAVRLDGLPGVWQPFPVDYKRGRPKAGDCDEVQLCAQALCLEEMLEVRVASGALFYGQRKRRHAVEFDEELRRVTCDAARRYHDLIESRQTPLEEPGEKCRRCSLHELCLPETAAIGHSVGAYLAKVVADHASTGEMEP